MDWNEVDPLHAAGPTSGLEQSILLSQTVVVVVDSGWRSGQL